MVKNSLIIASHVLIIKYLAIILSHMLTKRPHRSIICSHTVIIRALRSIIWSHTVIIHYHTLISLSSMLIIQSHTSIMYSHTPITVLALAPDSDSLVFVYTAHYLSICQSTRLTLLSPDPFIKSDWIAAMTPRIIINNGWVPRNF